MLPGTKHIIETVTCKKTDCDKTFRIVVSSIYTAVTSPIQELQIKRVSSPIIVDKEGEIDDYIVVKCQCDIDHQQRVYLKKKDERS